MLQPELSKQLKERKVRRLEETDAELVAAGNLGCMIQIATATDLPVVHTVELLDWAYGGPPPSSVRATSAAQLAQAEVQAVG